MRTDTGLRDSYGEPIYEGDVLYDEVGNFFNYVVKHNGQWYAAHNSEGSVLTGSIEGGYGRRCQVIHAGGETVAELWDTHQKRDLREDKLRAKIVGLEQLAADQQSDLGDLTAQVGTLLELLKQVRDHLTAGGEYHHPVIEGIDKVLRVVND